MCLIAADFVVCDWFGMLWFDGFGACLSGASESSGLFWVTVWFV